MKWFSLLVIAFLAISLIPSYGDAAVFSIGSNRVETIISTSAPKKKGLFGGLGKMVGKVGGGLVKAVETVGGGVGGAVKTVGDTAGTILNDLGNGAVNTVGKLGEGIHDLGADVLSGGIAHVIPAFVNGAGNVFGEIGGTANNVLKDFGIGLKKMVNPEVQNAVSEVVFNELKKKNTDIPLSNVQLLVKELVSILQGSGGDMNTLIAELTSGSSGAKTIYNDLGGQISFSDVESILGQLQYLLSNIDSYWGQISSYLVNPGAFSFEVVYS